MHHAVTTPARPAAERPSRTQIEPVALAVLARHSAGLLATARRYSLTPEDAEDAYQRGVEILLTKAPTTSEDELLPWLKTVVKHEAFAVRRSSGARPQPPGTSPDETDLDAWTDERAERYERLRLGAEAMSDLKPQEIRCLLLKAEGLSYEEICNATGFSYTKVNRCLTEGRRAFLKRIAAIESGAECERLAPLISKVADGEADADEMRRVRAHLKGCLACKATLREYRAAPGRLAGLVPPVVALAGGGAPGGFLARISGALQERFAGLTDIAVGQKAAAVAATAVVLASGGAAGAGVLHHDSPRVAPSAFERVADATPAADPRTPTPPRPDSAVTAPVAEPTPAPTADPPSEPAHRKRAADPQPGTEFDPGATAPPPTPVPQTEKVTEAREPASGGGEFGP
jgi:RNA polymerase sigma factor (sigma-70 family)